MSHGHDRRAKVREEARQPFVETLRIDASEFRSIALEAHRRNVLSPISDTFAGQIKRSFFQLMERFVNVANL